MSYKYRLVRCMRLCVRSCGWRQRSVWRLTLSNMFLFHFWFLFWLSQNFWLITLWLLPPSPTIRCVVTLYVQPFLPLFFISNSILFRSVLFLPLARDSRSNNKVFSALSFIMWCTQWQAVLWLWSMYAPDNQIMVFGSESCDCQVLIVSPLARLGHLGKGKNIE